MKEYIQRTLDEYGVKSLGIGTRTENGKVSAYTIEIPEKGNKQLIDLLTECGWKKTFRRKVRTDSLTEQQYIRNQYEGYAMYITLTLDI